MNKISCIYYFFDDNKVPFYVGMTKDFNQRIRNHLCSLNNMSRLPVYNKVRKLIKDTNLIFEKDIIKSIELCDIDKLEEKEISHIKLLKEAGNKLKNLTNGGKGTQGWGKPLHIKAASKRLGLKRSEETRKRMSEASKGKKKSDEHKKALSEAWKTRPLIY